MEETKNIKILPEPETSIKANWNDLVISLGFKENLESRIINPIIKDGQPKDYGIILFGPPGTGKTTVPYAIAKILESKDWKIRVLSPKHFLGSELGIERAIKKCFDEISCLYKDENGQIKKINTIFVFDEIDELVVARGSGSDRESRLMTTMMLPLFQDLRDDAKEANCMFFVLTNCIDRFDPAIKRLGRFDLILPVGPPDRQARYLQFEKSLDKLKDDYADPDTGKNIDIHWDVDDDGNTLLVDLNIISRASQKLGFGDINSICKRVVENVILVQPHSIEEIEAMSDLYVINLRTQDFIEWINKFRNSNEDNEKEIDRFYREYAIYSRGASPYSELNNIQEKIHHQFASLNIKHNLKSLEDGLKNGKKEGWNTGQTKTMTYSLRNLGETSDFTGSIIVRLANAGAKKSVRKKMVVSSGNSSPTNSLDVTPTRSGILKVTFTVEGYFEVRGIESLLENRLVKLSGSFTKTEFVKIKKP